MDKSAKNIINRRLLSIPPYISTTWDAVSTIHTKNNELFVSLFDGEIIQVPEVTDELIQLVFDAHASFISDELKQEEDAAKAARLHKGKSAPFLEAPFGLELPSTGFKLGAIDGSQLLCHNPDQKNLPNLPKPLLQKITALTKMILPEEEVELPKPEPHCNCMHCQISRAMLESKEQSAALELVDDTVTNEDLTFCNWDVAQTKENLFLVTNKLDPLESYTVFLGDPVGCTCGKKGCEHMIAALKS